MTVVLLSIVCDSYMLNTPYCKESALMQFLIHSYIGLLHSEEIEDFVKKVMRNPNPEAATGFVKMLDRDRDGNPRFIQYFCFIVHCG